MKSYSNRIALTLIALFALAQPAAANTVFIQAPGNNQGAFISDLETPNQIADNFVFAAATTVKSVRWWGEYAGNAVPAGTNFQLRFSTDTGFGTPLIGPFDNQTVTATRVATALVDSGLNIFQFTANLTTPIAFAGGPTYYLSVVENVAGSTFAWSDSILAGTHSVRATDGVPWVSGQPKNMAFELSDTVSTPVNAVPLPAAGWGGLALITTLGVTRALRRRQGDLIAG